jgi:hypothetical protein
MLLPGGGNFGGGSFGVSRGLNRGLSRGLNLCWRRDNAQVAAVQINLAVIDGRNLIHGALPPLLASPAK